MERILPDVVAKGIRVIANAGGVNPRACAEAVLEVARKLGLGGKVKVGLVSGDDILARLDELLAAGHQLEDMDTGRPLSDVRDKVLSANAYLGMRPMVEALERGANVVITGRVTDTGLTLGPLVHEFGWDRGRLGPDRGRHHRGTHHRVRGAELRAATCLHDWRSVKGLENRRASRSSRRRRTARSSSPSIRAPAAW